MNKQKQAKADAFELSRAAMFYGEGAGTRRKLIQAQVDQRMRDDPSYRVELERALANEDMVVHAKAARKERNRTDTNGAISRNVKAAATGNVKQMNTSVIVLIGGAYIAHKTGYDKVIYEKTKRGFGKLRAKVTLKAHDILDKFDVPR